MLTLALVIGMLSVMSLTAYAGASISKGKYISLGDYNGINIDWFCALTNNTGTLMLSHYILKPSTFCSNVTYKTSNVHK